MRDSGIGIAPEVLPHVFSAFTQADNSTTRQFGGGTGLSLAISQQLVGLLGGTISAESDPDQGSTFRFQVPVAPAKRPTTEVSVWDRAAARSARDHASESATGNARVLIAEDNRVNRMVAMQQLRALGYEAAAVENGLEVLEILDRERFDLVLMDCQMPEMDGYEATRRIRRQETDGTHLPIIAITAHAMKGDRDKCLAAGMVDYIAKPFRADEIATVLEGWLPSTPGTSPRAEARAGALAEAPVRVGEPDETLVLETIAALHELGRETGTDALRRVIDAFLDQTPAQLAELRGALEDGDGKMVAEIAHSLKGISAQLGASHFSKLCADLVEAARSSGGQGLAERLAAVQQELERLIPELEELRMTSREEARPP